MSKVAPVPGAGRNTKKSPDCNQEDSKQGSEAPPKGEGSSVLYASNPLSEGVTILSPFVYLQQGWNLEGGSCSNPCHPMITSLPQLPLQSGFPGWDTMLTGCRKQCPEEVIGWLIFRWKPLRSPMIRVFRCYKKVGSARCGGFLRLLRGRPLSPRFTGKRTSLPGCGADWGGAGHDWSGTF